MLFRRAAGNKNFAQIARKNVIRTDGAGIENRKNRSMAEEKSMKTKMRMFPSGFV